MIRYIQGKSDQWFSLNKIDGFSILPEKQLDKPDTWFIRFACGSMGYVYQDGFASKDDAEDVLDALMNAINGF